MVSTVRSRPNHYETLGLAPTATSAEIAQAFVREISVFRPRAFGGVAQVSIAYETLRDPIKRRAYDALIGLRPEPELREQSSFLGLVLAAPVERPAVDALPPPAPQVNSKPPSEPLVEWTPGSFIAASLRDPVNPDARHDTSEGPRLQPEELRRPRAEAKPRPAPNIGGDRILHGPQEQRLPDVDGGPIEWKRTAAAVGALVLAVGLLGAWAGWEAGNDIEPDPPQRAATLAIPPAKARPTTTAPSPAPARSMEEARPERATRTAVAAARMERTPPARQATASNEQQSEPTGSEQSQLQENATEEAVAESPPVAAVAPTLPLPNRVIARTIERIGYACGQVASTALVEGEASGVYKVTCTSGQSYQARPVKGRYRFRRWGSH